MKEKHVDRTLRIGLGIRDHEWIIEKSPCYLKLNNKEITST